MMLRESGATLYADVAETVERRGRRHAVLMIAIAVSVFGVMSQPPIAQDPAYNVFADERSLFGIPNALNVLSNVAFGAAGAIGLAVVFSRSARHTVFREGWRRWPYAAVFAGTLLTAVGSAYYHLAADNARLVWDRLPMTVGFMGLVAAVLAERLSVRLARILFVPLLLLGAASVGYWRLTELSGAGDLRPYVLAQFGALLTVVLLLLLYPARERGTRYVVIALVAYAVAKGCELTDAQIFAVGAVVSGHTLKHFLAAVAVGCLVAMIRARVRSHEFITKSN
jgi:hypothetical protein